MSESSSSSNFQATRHRNRSVDSGLNDSPSAMENKRSSVVSEIVAMWVKGENKLRKLNKLIIKLGSREMKQTRSSTHSVIQRDHQSHWLRSTKKKKINHVPSILWATCATMTNWSGNLRSRVRSWMTCHLHRCRQLQHEITSKVWRQWKILQSCLRPQTSAHCRGAQRHRPTAHSTRFRLRKVRARSSSDLRSSAVPIVRAVLWAFSLRASCQTDRRSRADSSKPETKSWPLMDTSATTWRIRMQSRCSRASKAEKSSSTCAGESTWMSNCD